MTNAPDDDWSDVDMIAHALAKANGFGELDDAERTAADTALVELQLYRMREPAIEALLAEIGSWIVSLYDEPVGNASVKRLHRLWLEALRKPLSARLRALVEKAYAKMEEYE